MNVKSAIVVGSGVAGMAVAIRLAVKGYAVTVYEKNSYPGGKLSLIEKDGYRFDAGPSLFTDPQELEALFALANEPINAYINYKKIDCTCKYFFSNGKIIHTWSDRDKLVAEFLEKAGEPEHTIAQYLDQSEKLYDNIGNIFLNNPLQKKETWIRRSILKALTNVRPYLLINTMNEYHEAKFKTGEAIQIFNRFATYNGSNPYSAPAMMSIIPHIELNGGAYYPTGGMISITNALYQLALKKGVRFSFNTYVQKINIEEGIVKGITTAGETIPADVVVSNADVYFTYKYLLGNETQVMNLERKEKSSSAIVFYWGIKKQFPQLQLHNIFFSGDYKAEFKCLFNEHTIYRDPTIYINVTSKMETGHAPEGKENWFVMINAPANYQQNWEELVRFTRKQVLKKLRAVLKDDIEPHIETETILDPPALEKNTGAWSGSLYGPSSNSRRAAFARHPNFSNKIQGLYFCGGTVHPGGGIPLCLKSAKIVGEMVPSVNGE
ncbi:MAG: phytoene desaturase family protein [Agriterribacter sp.]